MIPGLTTKLSERSSFAAATTIAPRADLNFVSGTTNVSTILPPFGGFSGCLVLVATDPAGFATVTGGNIALAVSLTTNKATLFVYSKKNNLWYPGAIS